MFTINRPEVYIGRNNDCDLSLNFPTVSKKHCKVTFIGNGYLLEDLGSSNGTIVNSKQTQKVILKHGDVVRQGEVILNFRF
jgi:pSer/pThr/pTyr-binding forkhead associated (FHA) protein